MIEILIAKGSATLLTLMLAWLATIIGLYTKDWYITRKAADAYITKYIKECNDRKALGAGDVAEYAITWYNMYRGLEAQPEKRQALINAYPYNAQSIINKIINIAKKQCEKFK
jgi:hypothetical protein